MFKKPRKIYYALPETIGEPDLFAGRQKEFNFFLGDWYKYLEKNFAQNQAIISRRKKGKTAFLQRLFNVLWSCCLEDKKRDPTVIPFYYSIQDTPIPLESFSLDFYNSFIKCYLSFTLKEPDLLASELDLSHFIKSMEDPYIQNTYKTLKKYEMDGQWERMWQLVSRVPASVARMKGIKIIQIIDEFQNINNTIYNQRGEIINRMSSTYMQVAEMREAPIIVSGSEVNWLLGIVSSLTGRFQTYTLENLPEKEAKKAIHNYAKFTDTRIDEKAKQQIWNLTKGDPLYIKALFLSRFNNNKNYTEENNIVEVYKQEIEKGEIYGTWMEYMRKTFNTVNKVNSKRIMLYLFQEGVEKTRTQIKKALNLPYSDEELEKKLEALIKGDLISQGSTAYRYSITRDKTYELFFKKKYQDEIDHFVPDIQKELKQEMGKDSYLKGKYKEFLIKEKLKKPFNLKNITKNGPDLKLTPIEVEERRFVKTGIGNSEIDLYIKSKTEQQIYIDVKNTKAKYGKRQMERWLKIKDYLEKGNKNTLFLVYSENGFTKGTQETLIENGILIIK